MALNFPAKIYQILENESADIIRWHPNGAAFRIVDHGRFEREIIPKYFRHNQISSVQRQLNLYGFKCISRGEDKGAFFHPKFRRGDWEIVKRITRYAPGKKANEGEKKEGAVGVDDLPLDNSIPILSTGADQLPLSNDRYHQALNAGFGAYNNSSVHYNAAPFEYYDQTAYNTAHWHWSMLHSTPIYAHNFMHIPSQHTSSHPHALSTYSAPAASKSVNMETSSVDSYAETPVTESKYEVEAEQLQQGKGFISVVNSVVTVDPYFDFGTEFDLFQMDAEVSSNASSSVTPVPKHDDWQAERRPAANGNPLMVDMGMNTELSMSNPKFLELCNSL